MLLTDDAGDGCEIENGGLPRAGAAAATEFGDQPDLQSDY